MTAGDFLILLWLVYLFLDHNLYVFENQQENSTKAPDVHWTTKMCPVPIADTIKKR